MNKETDIAKEQLDNHPTSERRCVIDGKRFVVTRHFEGNKDINTLITEIAVHRANREMGL